MENQLIKPGFSSLIFDFRGYKVMVDSDLAALYEVSTKAFKQQVRRNIGRFPMDFMFALTDDEKEQLVTKCDRFTNLKHSSVNPMVFTEQGVAMLSSVLRSEKAIKINIEIMRAFANYRALLRENDELRSEIRILDQKLHTAFNFLMERLDQLHQKKTDLKPVGYKYSNKKENQ